MCIRHAFFVKRPHPTRMRGAGPQTQTPFHVRSLSLRNFFFLFPTSSPKPHKAQPCKQEAIEHVPIPSRPDYLTHKTDFSTTFSRSAAAPAKVTPKPDASARVSQGSDIFAKAALQKSRPVCTLFVRSCGHFRFYFSGKSAKYFPSERER